MRKVVYPLLFAISPVLFLFAHNISEVVEVELVLPLTVAIIGTTGILFILKLIVKSYAKAGIATLLFLVLFYTYSWAINIVFPGGAVLIKPNVIMFGIWASVFIGGVVILRRINKRLATTTTFFNIVAMVLVLISLGNIGIGIIGGYHNGSSSEYPTNVVTDNMPDIYYIILDTYARQDVLKGKMGYDNSYLIDYLRGKGFYVADKSCSNYATTRPSLASSLNMDFIGENGLIIEDTVSIYEAIVNSKVSQFLRAMGYQYIFVDGGINIKGMDREASVQTCTEAFNIELGDFSYELCKITALAPVISLFSNFGDDITSPVRYGANNVLYAFDILPTISLHETGKPIFVYAHIMCPHPPGFFGKNGIKRLVLFGENEGFYPIGYLDNVDFINSKIIETVDAILVNSEKPPVIVLQGDHGVLPLDNGYFDYSHEILNAYYLPISSSGEGNKPVLYDGISPVNSFRVIFNYYFGTELELLEDRLVGVRSGRSKKYSDSPSD